MKKLLFFLLFALPIAASAHQNPGLDAIKSALGSGDIDGLSRFFGESVEVSILESEQIFQKAQAVDAVRNFFSQNKPKSFAQMHSGKSKGNDDQYCIGSLTTANGTFRVYLYLKMGGGQPAIQEIRFDKE